MLTNYRYFSGNFGCEEKKKEEEESFQKGNIKNVKILNLTYKIYRHLKNWREFGGIPMASLKFFVRFVVRLGRMNN